MVKKPTIKDVARRAGVSIATVSFVLNNSPGQVISEPVKKKVMKAAKALNYHPSAIAAGLASRRTGNIAIVFYRSPDLISNQYYSFVLEGAIREAARRGYNLFFSYVDAEYGAAEELPKVVREGNTDGVIFVKQVHPQMVRDIESRAIPVVVIDHFPRTSDVNAIEIDNFRGAEMAAEHLIALGHRRIACLFACGDRPSIQGRLDGYRHAMELAGIPLHDRDSLVDCGDLGFEAGLESALHLLSRKRRPTAILCVNDELAAGVLRAAHGAGLSVPSDLSVTGFDNITMSRFTDPPITTVSGDKEELGAHAIRRLVEIIARKSADKIQEVLPVSLIVRNSTAVAP